MTSEERLAAAIDAQTEAIEGLRALLTELLAEMRKTRVKSARSRGPISAGRIDYIDPAVVREARLRMAKAGLIR